MHGLLAPLLAQLVTLAVADRLEGHYVLNKDEHYAQSTNATNPSGTLGFNWRRATLSFTYSPSFQLVPVWSSDAEQREVLLMQRAVTSFSYRWRSTTLTLNDGLDYGQRDFAQEAIAAGQPLLVPANGTAQPAATQPSAAPPGSTAVTPGTASGQTGNGTSTTGTGTTAQPTNTAAFNNGRVDYIAARMNGSLEHLASRVVSWRVGGGYTISGGLGRSAQVFYPLSRGPDASVSVRVTPDGRTSLTTLFLGQLIENQAGDSALLTTLNEDYSYSLTRRLVVSAGGGMSFTRTGPAVGLPLYGIYPMGHAAIAGQSRLGRSVLSVNAGASASPVLDITTTTIDPRVAVYGGASWRQDRLSVSLLTNTQLSLSPGSSNAFSAVFVGTEAAYLLPGDFTASGGVRGSWQRLGGQNLILPSAIFYMALAWRGAVTLNRAHR